MTISSVDRLFPVGTTYTDRVVAHDSSTPLADALLPQPGEELLRSVTADGDRPCGCLPWLYWVKKQGELLAEIPDEMTPEDKVYLVSPGTYGDTAMGNSVNTVILERSFRDSGCMKRGMNNCD